jgi:hypothetical protein
VGQVVEHQCKALSSNPSPNKNQTTKELNMQLPYNSEIVLQGIDPADTYVQKPAQVPASKHEALSSNLSPAKKKKK